MKYFKLLADIQKSIKKQIIEYKSRHEIRINTRFSDNLAIPRIYTPFKHHQRKKIVYHEIVVFFKHFSFVVLLINYLHPFKSFVSLHFEIKLYQVRK